MPIFLIWVAALATVGNFLISVGRWVFKEIHPLGPNQDRRECCICHGKNR